MASCLCVALGGAVGAMLRYLIGLIKINESFAFPIKTLIINVVGSFLIGLIAAFAGSRSNFNADLLLLLKVGVCGGFTTFSTFALETAGLIQDGKLMTAFLYAVLSAVLSVAAVFLSQYLIK